MATTPDNLLDPGPQGTYPNWPRDENGKPSQPVDEDGSPIRYARGMTGELYSVSARGAACLDSGRPPLLAIPKLPLPDWGDAEAVRIWRES
jgi:hypothetical protein